MDHLGVFVLCKQGSDEVFGVVEHIEATMAFLVLLVYWYVDDIGEKWAVVGLQTIQLA